MKQRLPCSLIPLHEKCSWQRQRAIAWTAANGMIMGMIGALQELREPCDLFVTEVQGRVVA